MEYSSKAETFSIPAGKLYGLLSDCHRLAETIPPSLGGCKLAGDELRFTLGGMLPCTLKIDSAIPESQVSYLIASGQKMSAMMDFHIEPAASGQCTLRFHVAADIPPFMDNLIRKSIGHAAENAVESLRNRLQ